MIKSIRIALFVFLAFFSHARAAETSNQSPIKVVATFSILGDMVAQVGGPDVTVQTLVGPDEDAHGFQPSPDDVKKLAGAEIIAINGLKYEGWLHRLIKASGTKAKLLVTSAGVKPRVMNDEDHKGEIIPDPHAWQDLRNGQLYARNIAGALIEARPDRADQIKQRARAYIATLAALDQTTRESFAKIPTEKRKIITGHDAFGYFAAAYGLQFIAPVGMSTESEPSAADVANLIRQIKEENVQTLFIENMTDPRLIQQIAKDTGTKIGGKLYADALSKPTGEAPTYFDMMKANINALTRGIE